MGGQFCVEQEPRYQFALHELTHANSGPIVKELLLPSVSSPAKSSCYRFVFVFAIAVMWGSLLLRVGCQDPLAQDSRRVARNARETLVPPLLFDELLDRLLAVIRQAWPARNIRYTAR